MTQMAQFGSSATQRHERLSMVLQGDASKPMGHKLVANFTICGGDYNHVEHSNHPHLLCILAGCCCVAQVIRNLRCCTALCRLLVPSHRMNPLRLPLCPTASPALPCLYCVDAPTVLLAFLPVPLVLLTTAKYIHPVALHYIKPGHRLCMLC